MTRITEDQIAKLAASVKAPESLHERVQEMVEQADARAPKRRRSAARRRRPAWSPAAWSPARLGVAATAAAGLAAVAVGVGVSGGGSSGLTVAKAAALTLRPATMGAPRESAANHTQLDVSVQGVAFPYWRERFGWRSAGERVDRVDGRSVTTVFYADRTGRWIGYAIASGRAPQLTGGTVRWSSLGVPYSVSTQGDATVVAWPRKGHLCVVSGHGVDTATLLRLAGWRQSGAASLT
ncbi:MAG: hypothetical protein ACTHM1_04645 [Solirubrobacteraceae bacterium]